MIYFVQVKGSYNGRAITADTPESAARTWFRMRREEYEGKDAVEVTVHEVSFESKFIVSSQLQIFVEVRS